MATSLLLLLLDNVSSISSLNLTFVHVWDNMISYIFLDLLINPMFAGLPRFCWNARISLSGSLEEGSIREASRRLGLWYVLLAYGIFRYGSLS